MTSMPQNKFQCQQRTAKTPSITVAVAALKATINEKVKVTFKVKVKFWWSRFKSSSVINLTELGSHQLLISFYLKLLPNILEKKVYIWFLVSPLQLFFYSIDLNHSQLRYKMTIDAA